MEQLSCGNSKRNEKRGLEKPALCFWGRQMKKRLVEAHREQLPEIMALYREAIENMRSQGIEQWDEIYPSQCDIERDIETQSMAVFMEGTSVLAVIAMNAEQDPAYRNANWEYTQEPIAALHRLCVHPKAQGKGIGKIVVALAENRLAQQGYATIRLDAFSQNIAANALYRSLGYRAAGEITLRKGQFYLYEKRI
jgi:ribosomal protein S18 acetylase RimI-like enzyme